MVEAVAVHSLSRIVDKLAHVIGEGTVGARKLKRMQIVSCVEKMAVQYTGIDKVRCFETTFC